MRALPALLITATVLATALPGSVACAKRAGREPCPGGRFLVQGVPVLGEEVVVLEGGTLAIGGACPAVAATTKGSAKRTRVKARWAACAGVEGPLRLTAKIVGGCGTMKGKLKRRGAKAERFVAARSVCGDGVLDRAAGEQCETAADCPAAVSCTSCVCPGPPTTTTSPVPTTTSTSSTTSTTVFSGALAPDYVMFTGLETGADNEPSLMLGCSRVQSPVRSGRYACGIAQGLFVPLRPSFSLAEVYVRVYHHVVVTTRPSAEAFTPVIVTDREAVGVTAVDLGVRPDGTVRYRLRDRLNGVDLGFSEPMAPGQWVWIELFTAIGDGDGRAELRLGGVPVVGVTDLELGDLPMDTIFLSNNPNQYGGANGGAWVATFDDVAVTANEYPGAGRVVARQGRPGPPTYAQWTVVGAADVSQAWSQTPPNAAARAESPALGDPVAQTMLVAPFSQGLDPIAPGNTIKACQTWARFGLVGTPENRTYAVRRRVGGADTDTVVGGLESGPKLRSDGLDGSFWRAPLAALDAAEIGAVKSGGAGGTGLAVDDAWLVCEYQ